jgi:heme-degrading monooxygenase HmoA
MIARHWRGLAKHAHVDHYIAHLRRETFPTLATIPGFLDATILRRSMEPGVEFVIMTHWQSLEAIQQFAGQDSEVAVVPENVQNMMIDYDRIVRHYEVVDALALA